MSEPRFTRGPWVAIPQFVRLTLGAHQPIFKDGLWGVLPEDDVERLPIATVDCGDDHHEPTRANAEYDARLIAASPDLFKAAREALMVIRKIKPPEYGNGTIVRLEDAIAKALGERS